MKIVGLILLMLATPLWAQTFTVLHAFTNSPDGASPYAGLVLNNGTLYGAAYSGGANGAGAIFRLNTNGAGYSVIKSFGPLVNVYGTYTNTDGANPFAALTVSGSIIYGTASGGGSAGNGTVYRLGTNGTQFSILKVFTNDSKGVSVDGSAPKARLILNNNLLYGVSSGALGNLFEMNTNGTGFSTIKRFVPNGDLVLSGDTFYGTDATTVFCIKTNGLDYTILHTFTNSPDGSGPLAGLVMSGITLYGTTSAGGSTGWGTIFKINMDGSGYEILRSLSFDADGGHPEVGMVLIGDKLYGSTYQGGPAAFGTLFTICTNGTGFAVLRSFAGNDGLNPSGNLMADGTVIYGVTITGGLYNAGTIYSLDLTPITLKITGSMPVLSASWNAISNHVYQLQFTTNLASTNWQSLGNPITATSNAASTSVTLGSNAPCFIRVTILR
jgi:uncharacterized repeat protein (TIGR03803 family)